MTPPDMTDEQLFHFLYEVDRHAQRLPQGLKLFAKAIIEARDKQWTEMREADEALMREALDALQMRDVRLHDAAADKLRARLGGV
jgi:hypothetical protein